MHQLLYYYGTHTKKQGNICKNCADKHGNTVCFGGCQSSHNVVSEFVQVTVKDTD